MENTVIAIAAIDTLFNVWMTVSEALTLLRAAIAILGRVAIRGAEKETPVKVAARKVDWHARGHEAVRAL